MPSFRSPRQVLPPVPPAGISAALGVALGAAFRNLVDIAGGWRGVRSR